MSRTLPVLTLLVAAATCTAGETEWRTATNDPAAAKLWLHPGVPIESVLDSLNAKGFRITYKSEHILPSMTLLERPKAKRIDTLLREILTPYDLHADHTLYGEWKVKPLRKKRAKVEIEQVANGDKAPDAEADAQKNRSALLNNNRSRLQTRTILN